MDVPRVDGLKVLSLLGQGGCGGVYLAEDEHGARVAVKLFESAAIRSDLLARMTARLEAGGWPDGVMPVIAEDFEGLPAIRVMPLMVECLSEKMGGLSREEIWELVKSIAAGLGNLHSRLVIHGNLKPGNVFFDETGAVRLADWTLGNMPGIERVAFTDALYYQSPEQLAAPADGLEQGYRWDVFSFGVLAYRLLTGIYPRCDELFSDSAHMQDPLEMVEKLKDQPEVAWPDEPANPIEAGFREWIIRCLHLDGASRPATMREVVAGFADVERQTAVGVERAHLLDQRRHAERRTWRVFFLAAVLGAIALALGALWQFTNTQWREESAAKRDEILALRETTRTAVAEASRAEDLAEQAIQARDYEKELANARLEASRLIGDRLFSWAMEKGHRRLPPLDGRLLRLKQLETYFEDFLTRTADVESLKDERARVRLQLAEITLAAGNSQAATARLTEALIAVKDLPSDGELKFRLATDRLLLALLLQSNGDAGTAEAFVSARNALTAVPQTEVESDRLNQLLAILDFHEAKLLADKGEHSKALEQLLRATQSLNRLADQRPDVAVLRSELAACYLSSATILEGMGSLGDAREVRGLAAAEISRMLKEKPEDPVLRQELAGCYSAMSEAAVLSGDTAAAENLSREALKLLDRLLGEQPDNAELSLRKAAQLGVQAGLLRDKGQGAEAMRHFEEGIRILEGVRASSPQNGIMAYRLGQLWWQRAKMVGMTGNRDEEISQLKKARDLFAQIETWSSPLRPQPELLQSSGAYVLGDMGHSYQLAGRKEEARHAFEEAASLWGQLLQSHPRSEEYDEGLSWCRQRLSELK